jgi:hypothetical protein
MKKIRENENNFSPNRKNFSFSKKQGLEPAIPGQSQVTFGTQRASYALRLLLEINFPVPTTTRA